MLKKRIIFTLLYADGNFMLSRNFRLQKVGNLDWLKKNYNFSHISSYIDELIIFDVSRNERNIDKFCKVLNALTDGCFVPITAGGGIRKFDDAKYILRSGADKISINTLLFSDLLLVKELVSNFGKQCVVGSIDLKKTHGEYQILTDSGKRVVEKDILSLLSFLEKDYIGELYINSINQDGTGQGYDLDLLENIPNNMSIPLILAGGVGNALHLLEGLKNSKVDAVATAHLFNFIGDGLRKARQIILDEDIQLASWKTKEEFKLIIERTE
jgi:cyclase